MRPILLFSLIFLLTACEDTRRGDFVEEFGKKIIELGMRPVYPPREDLQIGDVFLVSVPKTKKDPDSKRSVASLAKRNPSDYVFVHLGNSPAVVKEAKKYLRNRLVLQRTNNPEKQKPDEGEFQDDLFGGALTTRQANVISTLPIVAFPSISADAGQGIGLGIVRVFAALGLASSSRTNVRLDFVDVRSLKAPEGAVLGPGVEDARRLYDHAMQNKNTVDAIDQKFFSELAALVQGNRFRLEGQPTTVEDDFANRCYRIVVITEVYLTRRIDYTYDNRQIRAVAVKNATQSTTPSKTSDVPAASATIIQAPNPPDTGVGISTVVVGNEELTTVQEQAKQLINRTQQGDSLTFESWDALGVRFSRTYERPVTVGWRGYDFAPDHYFFIRDRERVKRPNSCLLDD